jgi:PhnB protein
MASISRHIHFNGNAEKAFEFYKSVFGGEFTCLKRFSELNSPEFSFQEEEQNKIMLVRLPIGGSTQLSGSDVPNFLGVFNEEENRSKITISADSKEEAELVSREDVPITNMMDLSATVLNPESDFAIMEDSW